MKRIISCLLALMLCLALPIQIVALDISISQNGEVVKGETIVYEVRLAETKQVKSGSIKIVYDSSVLTVVDYTWHVQNTMIAMFDPATGNGAFACMMPVNVGDLIFSVTFQVAEDAQYGELPISAAVAFKDPNNPDVEEKTEVTDEPYVSCGDHQPGAAATCDQGQLCTVCGFEIVPALGHNFDGWDSDAAQHWNVCSACGAADVESKADHIATGDNLANCQNASVCDACGVSFGDVDAATHTGTTTLQGALEPSCAVDGYTGDTHCADCGVLLSAGDPIPATGDHTDANGMWEADSDAHFHTCACGYIFDVVAHNGGSATCTEKAICQDCGVAYGDVAPNVHTGGTYVENQEESTCYEYGYTGDIYCASCHALVEAGTVIGLKEHNPAEVWSDNEWGHWKACVNIGCRERIDYADHTGGTPTCVLGAMCDVCHRYYGRPDYRNHGELVLMHAEAATEEREGYTGDEVCVDCQMIVEYGHIIPKLDHTHNMTCIEANPQSCTSEGNIQYWNCTKCGKYYADEAGVQEIALSDTVIPQDAHSYSQLKFDGENHWYQCATCTATQGAEAHNGGSATCQALAVCGVCGQTYGELAGHDYVQSTVEAALKAEATCIAPAEYYESCSVCGILNETTFTDGEPNAANHVGGTYVEGETEATCESDGYTGDVYCESCHTILMAGQVIPGGHAMEYVEAVEADHYQAGNIGYYVCSVCEKLYADANGETELSAEDVIVPKGEHAFGEDFVSDENDHWKACDCGEQIEKEAHAFGDWTVTQEATEEQKGSKEKKCGVCGYTVTEEIPALEKEEVVTPPTGDIGNLMLWSFLMILSAIGAGLVLTVRRKQV